MKTLGNVTLLVLLGSLFCASTLVAQFDDPPSLTVKNATSAITLDGKLDEADWAGAPTLIYGNGAQKFKQAGEYTVTTGVDVKNPFTDQSVEYRVPNTDSSWARVKFLRKGMNLYIGITSNDKSICKFDWEADGIFMKIQNSVGQDREYKLYWQNTETNKDTIRYEEPLAGSGMGKGFLPAGSTVNDTSDVDNGYSAELMIKLDALGYTAPLDTVQFMLVVFDPDGFKHPMNVWDHTIGSYYKSWWGSEWGGTYRSLKFTPEPFEDPASLTVKNATSAITLDGKLDEADWAGAPTLIYGNGAQKFKQAGEYTVTAGVDVKNPFTDQGVEYRVPNTDSSWARVKFLRKGMNLYIGITSNDKSICKFDWEGDGIFMKIQNSVGQDREYKLYWQNTGTNKDTIRYEEQVANSGSGWGNLPTGSTVNDTSDVDNGYSTELMIKLDALGYTASLESVELALVVFDPDGFEHPMNGWDHTIGSYYKSWWGSEWGGTYRSLKFTPEPFDDPDTLTLKVAAGTMTLDGKLDEADWTGAPTLVFGMGAQLKKEAGEYTVTAGVDVKNPFTDQGVVYRVPHTDSTLTRVKFLQKDTKLYIGIQSDDKSICKFDWEGDGLFMKMKTGLAQEREFKLYWQNTGENKDTIRYEEQLAGSGMGKGFLPTGSTVNDTSDVDNGYQAELMVDLIAMGYYGSNVTIDLLIDIFDPDGFKHPMNAWDHTVGSYYKSWWGSEWGGVYRTLKLQSPITGIAATDLSIPTIYTLGQNYPNPFNPSTTIQYGLPTRSIVTLKVYDVVGRVVATLVNGEIPSGSHDVAFNAHTLASGLYFYRLSATPVNGGGQGPFVATKKLVLIK